MLNYEIGNNVLANQINEKKVKQALKDFYGLDVQYHKKL